MHPGGAAMDRSDLQTQKLDVLARFVQSIQAATDMPQLARTICQFVQGALPARSRDRRFGANFERSLEAVLYRLALEELPIGDQSAAWLLQTASNHIQPARSELEGVVETAAALLDATLDSAHDGSVLRAAIGNMQEAARQWMVRAANTASLAACRAMEALGAPAGMLYSLSAKPLWCNGALNQLLFRRQISREGLEAEGALLVQPMLAACWNRGFQRLDDQSQARPVPSMGLHLTAKLIHSPDRSTGETLARVEVSEAKRRTALSQRERQIALLLARQISYKAVASQAELSLDTVRTYVRRIYRKLAVNSRFALRQRLIHDRLLDADKSPIAP